MNFQPALGPRTTAHGISALIVLSRAQTKGLGVWDGCDVCMDFLTVAARRLQLNKYIPCLKRPHQAHWLAVLHREEVTRNTPLTLLCYMTQPDRSHNSWDVENPLVESGFSHCYQVL